jgi:hypothetical protein
MKILSDDLRVLCLSENSAVHGNEKYELCQLVAFDADNLANSLIGVNVSIRDTLDPRPFQLGLKLTRYALQNGENDENKGNSNSLQYFGLAKLLPAPTTIVP